MHAVDCHAFDGSIERLPDNSNPLIRFHKKYVGHDNSDTTSNMHDLIDAHQNIFLKMDIEGVEYDWITSLQDHHLAKLSQIVIEVHDPFASADRIDCLRRLASTHWLVHLHGNNFGNIAQQCDGVLVPTVFECTYVSRALYAELKCNQSTLPHPDLDFPNQPGRPDIPLAGSPYTCSR